jgi:hypothetical protein
VPAVSEKGLPKIDKSCRKVIEKMGKRWVKKVVKTAPAF